VEALPAAFNIGHGFVRRSERFIDVLFSDKSRLKSPAGLASDLNSQSPQRG
jgi:hypothetical protein